MIKKCILKFIVLFIVCVAMLDLSPSMKTFATELPKENSKEVENILKGIIEEYGEENMIFDIGLYVELGDKITEEALDYSLNWKAYDSSILHKEDYFQGIKSGTTFLIGEYENKFIVKEVYVYDKNELAKVSAAYNRNRSGQPLVYIDPGHGGSDPGASGNGIIEKHYVLDLGLRVKQKLEAKGIEVAITRTDDTYVSLQDRAIRSNNLGADAFVSIHANAAVSTAYGIETFYYQSIGNPLATSLQNKLINYTGAYNRGVKRDNFYVVTYTNMPSALVEVGFMTNKGDSDKLKDPAYQEKLVNAIVDGTVKYLEDNLGFSETKVPTERIYGATRYETAIKVFEKGWSKSDYAVIASGLTYADALSATPLAKKYDAPILLSKNASLSNQSELQNVLRNKGVKEVFIVGGAGVIPSSVEVELNNMGIATKRLGGANRYETSIEIAKALNSNTGEIALASGYDFPDGLSISTVAAQRNMPILLTEPKQLTKVVEDYINTLNINKSYIIGSEGAISSEVANKTVNPERLGGKDRYETNKLVYERFKSNIRTDEFYLASGLDFPDTLSSSALASKEGKFVLMTSPTSSNIYTKSILDNNSSSINKVYVLGSSALIPNSTLSKYGLGF